MMANFVKNFKAKNDRYPSDWAVMEYDAVYALKQGIEKAEKYRHGKSQGCLERGDHQYHPGQAHFPKY